MLYGVISELHSVKALSSVDSDAMYVYSFKLWIFILYHYYCVLYVYMQALKVISFVCLIYIPVIGTNHQS